MKQNRGGVRMVIGIIGGVGTGKSQIAAFLGSNYNAYVIRADQVGHEVMAKDTKAYHQIIELFGKSILDENGNINRKILGDIVFKDTILLNKLNNITHPLIYDEIVKQILEINNNINQYDFIILEAAIMVEAMWTKLVDVIWLITCSKEVRMQRLMNSRNLSREKIENIISNQQSEEELQSYADVIIDNSLEIEATFQQVKIEIMKALEAKHEKN
ncbi:MAG: dephospho-CoA kinase [Firmicutes bacterium HGW-Firmicutes-1]|jgi:dephospho-CoA kinase|nr:MAG: dephospho-CoA kinase [Firmicutes bacterium HGW-Firmicutes-1]